MKQTLIRYWLVAAALALALGAATPAKAQRVKLYLGTSQPGARLSKSAPPSAK